MALKEEKVDFPRYWMGQMVEFIWRGRIKVGKIESIYTEYGNFFRFEHIYRIRPIGGKIHRTVSERDILREYQFRR